MGLMLNPIKSTADRIQKQLDALDLKLSRPTQAITAALMNGDEPDPADRARFEELTAQKAALRAKL
jgi:hypothetical protein